MTDPRTIVQVGDVCLFGGTGWIAAGIEWRNDVKDVSHAELGWANGRTWTAKPTFGVNEYDFDPTDLKYIRRPVQFNATLAGEWLVDKQGLPYGWDTIASDAGFPIHAKANSYVCSTVVANGLKAGDAGVISDLGNISAIYPGVFLFYPESILRTVWDYRKDA